MTNEEIAQVQAYVIGLQTQAAQNLQKLQVFCDAQIKNEQKCRKLAQADSLKMGTAVHEIWKLCHSQSTLPPAQLAIYVRQIINHYCPDFDIPF